MRIRVARKVMAREGRDDVRDTTSLRAYRRWRKRWYLDWRSPEKQAGWADVCRRAGWVRGADNVAIVSWTTTLDSV